MSLKGYLFCSPKFKKVLVYLTVLVWGLQNLCPQEYNYHDFHTPMLEDPDFEAKPLVMVMGQYSTGKTTFIRFVVSILKWLFVFWQILFNIRYILEKDFPGMRIGPEPTTDTFHVVDYAGGVCWQQLELRKTVYYQCIINILLLHSYNHLSSHHL